MNKLVLKNPEDFNLESALITHDVGSGIHVMDVYDKSGHKEYLGKSAPLLKGKFTKELAPVNPNAKAVWLTMDYSEDSIDEEEEHVEDAVLVNPDAFMESAIAKRLVVWIDTLPEDVKNTGFDLGGTKYTFKEIRMDLTSGGDIGKLMVEAVMNMTLKFISGTLCKEDVGVGTSEENPVQAQEKPVEVNTAMDPQSDLGTSILFGMFTSLKYLPGGTIEATVQTIQDFLQTPIFEGGFFTRPFCEAFPVEIRLLPDGDFDGNSTTKI